MSLMVEQQEQSSCLSANYQTYRAALALNNMAVSLMERHCYRAAASTLCDSLSLMQTTFVPTSTETIRSKNKPKPTSSQSIWQNATQRFFQATPDQVSFQNDVQLLTTTDSLATNELLSYIERSLNSPVAIAIRITEFSPWLSSSTVIDEEESQRITRQFSIILYNHGLMNYLLSVITSSTDKMRQKKYRERSFKSLKVANESFTTIIQHRSDSQQDPYLSNKIMSDDEDYFDDHHDDMIDDGLVLLLTALPLNIMCLLFRSVQARSKMEEAQAVVTSICTSVAERKASDREIFPCLVTTAAPAA